MNEINIHRDSLVDEIRMTRELFCVEVASDELGLRQKLESLERRAAAIPANADSTVVEPIEDAFYDLVESAPELMVRFRRIRDAAAIPLFRRGVEYLKQLARQRPLTEFESQTLQEIQAEIDGITGNSGDRH